ncbi:hypothetical protein [Rhizobium sp. BK251]|nr:hypothetical protein [Rhizobium sp. BK251]TCL65731.1 hypothetical protein EV286_11249 [Rhizobium sp. BK251]
MTKSAILSAVFASYVAVMFAIASIPGEPSSEVSQAAAILTSN